MSQVSHQDRIRLHRLFYYRLIVVGILCGIAYFYMQPLRFFHQQASFFIISIYIFMIPIQWWFIKKTSSLDAGLGIQFISDLLLAGGLVLVSGGAGSPFSMLFGVIIIIAGSQVNALLILALSVASVAVYLTAIYAAHAWYVYLSHAPPDVLSVLLQCSALLLAGGVMAALTRQHIRLKQESLHIQRIHRDMKALHDQMMAVMHEALLVLDQHGVIQDSNQAARHVFTALDSIQGRNIAELFDIPASLAHFFQYSDHDSCVCEQQMNGQTFQISVVRLPQEDELSSWLLTMVDISETRALQLQLANHEKLAALGRMAAMLAHEIRNPLQTFSQAMELIPVENVQSHEMLGIMTDEVRRLKRLVSGMLDYTRPLQITPVSTEICSMIHIAIRQVDLADTHQIQVICDGGDVCVDVDHFRLLLDNLLRNAMIASPMPESIEVRMSTDTNGQWRLTVSDAGGGISDDIKQHLFEPFVTGRAEGMGLGLATVWQVCQANHWHIEVESTQHGSCFIVTGDMNTQDGG